VSGWTSAIGRGTLSARGGGPEVCRRDWGFDPEDVEGRVHLWHGTGDRLIPLRYVEPLAAALRNCVASFTADDGQFFFRARIREILAPLSPGERIGSEALVSGELAA
jgi:hypothetical protein